MRGQIVDLLDSFLSLILVACFDTGEPKLYTYILSFILNL